MDAGNEESNGAGSDGCRLDERKNPISFNVNSFLQRQMLCEQQQRETGLPHNGRDMFNLNLNLIVNNVASRLVDDKFIDLRVA